MADEHGATHAATILLVDDDDNDVELTRQGIKRSGVSVTLHRVESGAECLAYLRGDPPFADAPVPDLILLDLNLPGLDGISTLTEIVEDDRFGHIPVVILTTSNAAPDVRAAYRKRCSSYIIKPMDFRRFSEVIHDLLRYWFTTVVLPSDPSPSDKDE